MLVGVFRKPSGEWDTTDLIGGAGERAAIQLATSTLLRKRGDEKFKGHVVRRSGTKEVLETMGIGKGGDESISEIRLILLAAYCLPYIGPRFPKKKYNIFTLKMANAMFAETLYNIQHSTRLIPESRS
jgi:hypothetical protein